MVAGHSIYTSSSCGKVDREDSWFLESYQKHPGQAATFVAHIKEGVDVAGKDGSALLLFSGGETRKDAGPRSEAQSYWAVAETKDWFGECFRFSVYYYFFFKMSLFLLFIFLKMQGESVYFGLNLDTIANIVLDFLLWKRSWRDLSFAHN